MVLRAREVPVLSSFSVKCPHVDCGWIGSLVPSIIRGGSDAEIASMQRAWFHCPQCGRDWEVRMRNDEVTVLPAVDNGN
jgi:hypothetical protein